MLYSVQTTILQNLLCNFNENILKISNYIVSTIRLRQRSISFDQQNSRIGVSYTLSRPSENDCICFWTPFHQLDAPEVNRVNI